VLISSKSKEQLFYLIRLTRASTTIFYFFCRHHSSFTQHLIRSNLRGPRWINFSFNNLKKLLHQIRLLSNSISCFNHFFWIRTHIHHRSFRQQRNDRLLAIIHPMRIRLRIKHNLSIMRLRKTICKRFSLSFPRKSLLLRANQFLRCLALGFILQTQTLS